MKIKEGQFSTARPIHSNDDAPRLTAGKCATTENTWDPFLCDHSLWFGDRTKEGQIVYAFPGRLVDRRLAALFQLSEEALSAERAYARCCKSFYAVGFYESRPLVYRWLSPRLPAFDDSLILEMKTLGWTDDHLLQMKESTNKGNDIDERLMGSVGRLICSPAFCTEREELRREWAELPSSLRPPIPLTRSIRTAHAIAGLDLVELTEEQAEFAARFDRFCDRWRINGLVTWDLPEVDGPKWPQLESATDQLPGRNVIDTPWHFCLLAEDGLGELLRQEHEETANARGVDDLKSWCAYAHLFQIDFWEKVVQQRYVELPRRRGFVTAMNSFIADIVHLDIERVQKLRKLRSALQRGKQTSLAGNR